MLPWVDKQVRPLVLSALILAHLRGYLTEKGSKRTLFADTENTIANKSVC
jgi:hypothetical protein